MDTKDDLNDDLAHLLRRPTSGRMANAYEPLTLLQLVYSKRLRDTKSHVLLLSSSGRDLGQT